MEYLTVKEAGEKWGVTARMVNYYCSAGSIQGAVKKGNLWLVPQGAEKPQDGRYKSSQAQNEKGKIMNISGKIKILYDKDTKAAYANLQELEAISELENTLLPYLREFIDMLKSDKYAIRVRGFRLLCKQAKWDKENIINESINEILMALLDEKPTAIRQALQYLRHVVCHKRELQSQIREKVLAIDLSIFKDTMRPLIAKDIQNLVELITAQ